MRGRSSLSWVISRCLWSLHPEGKMSPGSNLPNPSVQFSLSVVLPLCPSATDFTNSTDTCPTLRSIPCPLYSFPPQYNGLFEFNGHLHRGNKEVRDTRKLFRALRHSALPRSIPPICCTPLFRTPGATEAHVVGPVPGDVPKAVSAAGGPLIAEPRAATNHPFLAGIGTGWITPGRLAVIA